MIIKEKIISGDKEYYRVFSDAGFYIIHKENNILFTEVSTTTPDLFEETDIKIVNEEILDQNIEETL